MMDFNAATVSELVTSIKGLLEEEFQEVMVQGEVTNLSPRQQGTGILLYQMKMLASLVHSSREMHSEIHLSEV